MLLQLQYITALKADMELSLSKNKQIETGLAYNLVTLIPSHNFFSGLMKTFEPWQQSRGEVSTVLEN